MSASSASMDPIGGLVVDTAGSVVKVKEAVTAAVGLSPGQVEKTARDGFTLHFGQPGLPYPHPPFPCPMS